MLTLDSFLVKFPEFESFDPVEVETALLNIQIEHSYAGLDSEVKQQHAQALHAAHILELQAQTKKTPGGGKVIKYKSKQDEIQYQTSSSLFGFDTTIYGDRLQRFLDTQPLFVNVYR